jgi:hypothetical protein
MKSEVLCEPVKADQLAGIPPTVMSVIPGWPQRPRPFGMRRV